MRYASSSRHIVAAFALSMLGACSKNSDRPQANKPSAAAPAASPQPSTNHAPKGARRGSYEDWCSEHQVPESLCTRCNPSLIAAFKGTGDWCAEHGFPESFCPICRPGAAIPDVGKAAVPADWCAGHGLPESKCTKCNPKLIPRFKAAGDWCEEHGFPESVCPVCNPQRPPAGAERAAIEARVVRFRSPDIERAAGIDTVTAKRAQASAGVDCTARIAFDADKVADVRAIVSGVVRRVRAQLGASVKRGAVLFELESTRVGEIQGTLQGARERHRTARSNLDRKRALRAGGIASAREVEIAERELAAARAEARAAEAALRMVGAARSTPSGRYVLSAPIAGTVVRRPAVVGMLATEGVSLATVADTSVMWAMCEVPEAESSRVALGQKVIVTVQGADQATFEGKLTWIAAEVNPRTRTVTARAAVPNPEGRLRANQFARARVETGAPRTAVSVPRSAVQRVGEREVVFVRASPGVYEPRVVRRHGDAKRVQVEGRLQAGERVVTTGAVLLRTEIMPGSIGAGCCDVDAPGSR